MAQATVGGITIEYEITGRGRPLLLVMGLGGQLVSWPPGFVETLVARGFQVITFDNRDSGLSTKGTMAPLPPHLQMAAVMFPRLARAEYLLADMAGDAFGLLDHLGIGRADVVGMSMGGMIAQTMAITRPERVRSLTSVMSTTGNRRVGRVAPWLLAKLPGLSRRDPATWVERRVELFRLVSGPAYDAAAARAQIESGMQRSFCPEGTARQTLAIAAGPDRTPGLRRLGVPTLVVHGLLDPLVQPSGGVATAEAVPGARLLMFPDMGHDIPTSRFGEIADAIAANAARAPATDRVGAPT